MRLEPSSPRLLQPGSHEVKLINGVRIGVDHDVHTQLSRPKQVPVMQVQTPWVCVELHRDIVRAGGLKNGLYIDGVGISPPK